MLFCNKLNDFNNTGVPMLDSIFPVYFNSKILMLSHQKCDFKVIFMSYVR